MQELVEQRDPELLVPLLAFRESILTSEDESWLNGYLTIGFFAGWTRHERLAAFALTFEAQREWKKTAVRALCEPYTESQLLFENAPDLYRNIRQRQGGTRDQELINVIATASVDGGEVYRAGKGYTELCSYLSPEIVNWARNEWPDAPTFIRLNADRYIAESRLKSFGNRRWSQRTRAGLATSACAKGGRNSHRINCLIGRFPTVRQNIGIITSKRCVASRFVLSDVKTTTSR